MRTRERQNCEIKKTADLVTAWSAYLTAKIKIKQTHGHKKRRSLFIHKTAERNERAYLHMRTQNKIAVLDYSLHLSVDWQLLWSDTFFVYYQHSINVPSLLCQQTKHSHNSLWAETKGSAIAYTIYINNLIQCDNVTVQYCTFASGSTVL